MWQREGALADEDSVDMDGENGRGFEEYEWAGQKRIRATALLEGGFRGTNTQASCCSVLVVLWTGQSVLLVLWRGPAVPAADVCDGADVQLSCWLDD